MNGHAVAGKINASDILTISAIDICSVCQMLIQNCSELVIFFHCMNESCTVSKQVAYDKDSSEIFHYCVTLEHTQNT